VNSDLQRFVRDALGRGLTRDTLRDELHKAAWRQDEIEAALGAWAESTLPVPVPRRRPQLSAREAFLYLVLFATLYTTAYDTGQVLFVLIERWLPDPLRGVRDGRLHGEWLRAATAGIIIAFPVFLFVSRVIGREVAREPEKRGSSIRKWLTYLTLLIAALVIIVDLTVLVTRVLGGELAPRFLLMVLVVFLIAGTVFGHYLGDLRREEDDAAPPRARATMPARVAAAGVFAVMIAGLVLSGTPGAERARQLDAQRIEALQQISGAIEGHYALHRRLPDSLAVLLRVPNGVAAETLRDPITARPYAYRAVDSLTYELCAEFDGADSEGLPRPRPIVEFWRHGPGPKCFQLGVPRGKP
jgi:uncharacterized protein DUF5671